MGTKITIVEFMPRVVPVEDEDISKELEKQFKKKGITIMTSAEVTKVDTSGAGVKATVKTAAGEQVLEADILLSAAGVVAKIENIGLEENGIKTEKGKIIVDKYQQTSLAGVYAIGDCSPGQALAHVAAKEGINAADSATIEPFSGNTNVVIYGGGGHCKVLLEVFFEEQKYQVKGIYDDNPKSDSLYGVKVSKSPPLSFFRNKNCIVAIGDNATRKKIVQQLQTNYVMTIHPTAVISKFAKIGHGTQIMATAVVNPDTEIGHHCIINTGAIVEHDCLLGDYVHISPNATLGGGVKVGEGTQIGIGASVLPNLTIGKNVMVGAGAVVVENIPDNAVVVGVPGKIIKYHNENNGK